MKTIQIMHFAIGLNNGVLYFKRDNGDCLSETGTESNWIDSLVHDKANWDYWTKIVDVSNVR